MTRYQGEELPERPRIAIVANDAIGNFVVSTPLLQTFRQRFPDARIDYFGGTRTRELAAASDLIDDDIPLHGIEPRAAIEAVLARPPYDLIFNQEQGTTAKYIAATLGQRVAGPCLDSEGRGDLPWQDDEMGRLWADRGWVAADLPSRYPFLRTGWIAEIFCRLAYWGGPVPMYRVPTADPGPVPDALVAMAASLPDKLWTADAWRATLRGLRDRGLTIGLLGAPRTTQGKYWQGGDAEDVCVREGLVVDLRGAFTLPQVAGALAGARLVLTLDNGILHLACAGPAPVVGLFRRGIHRLWAPPRDRLEVLTPPDGEPVSAIPAAEATAAISRILDGA